MAQIYLTHTNEYYFGESLAGAVRTFLGTELLLTGFLRLLSSEFVNWSVEQADLMWLQWLLVSAIVLFEIVAPACGRYRLLVYAGLEAGLLGLGGWYVFRQLPTIRGGIAGLCKDYLLAWNSYYKTNYLVTDTGENTGVGLYFLIAALVLLFLVLRYVTGVRWLMLIPPLTALGLGLLVNLCPSWEGLACVLMGTIVLYSGGADPSRVLFLPAKHGRKRIFRTAMQLLSALVAMVIALVTVFGSQWLFEASAQKIPERAPKFLAFQKQLEAQVEELVSGLYVESDEARVDNATPTYQDKLVMTISADRMPATNLYLPEFYSGTYENGNWESERAAYRSAAEAAQIDRDRLGTLLYQMGYESFDAISGYSSIANRNIEKWNYSISYEKKGSTAAFLPYFSDLSQADGAVWVEGEGLVKKERGTKELSFQGWNNNTDVLQVLFDMSYLDSDNQSQADMINWYSAYVMEHYCNASSLSAVQDAASSIASQVSTESGGAWPLNDTEDAMENNLCRIGVAGYVQRALAETAQYNLYLDDIPAGTDTIQYFLETGHEGYCMHFASAGALILQELGVPARYASGYYVKQTAFQKDVDGVYTAKVYDRNSHAWVEIYLEGIGWVPVEMTPGYEYVGGGLPTDADNQEQLKEQHENRNENSEDVSSSEVTESESRNTENTESENAEEEDTEYSVLQDETESGMSVDGGAAADDTNGRRKLPGKVLMVIFACVFLLVVITAGALYLIQRYRKVLWQDLNSNRTRRAVKRINRRIYRRLMGKGLKPMGHIRLPKRGRGTTGAVWLTITDAEYESRLIQTFRKVSPEEWRAYMQIVKKAAFSRDEVTKAEAQFCYQVYCNCSVIS